MRLLRWRAASVVAAAVIGVAWLLLARPSHVVQIQFGIAPEILAGAEVLIDGAVVGAIERRGSRTVNGFRVEPGEHTVEVRVAGWASEPTTVDTRVAGGTAVLMADLVDVATTTGGLSSTVLLR